MTQPRSFTAADDAAIRHSYGVMPIVKLARSLGRTARTIDIRAVFLGLMPRASRKHDSRTGEIILPEAFRDTVKATVVLATPPAYQSSFIKPPTRAQLMAGR